MILIPFYRLSCKGIRKTLAMLIGYPHMVDNPLIFIVNTHIKLLRPTYESNFCTELKKKRPTLDELILHSALWDDQF